MNPIRPQADYTKLPMFSEKTKILTVSVAVVGFLILNPPSADSEIQGEAASGLREKIDSLLKKASSVNASKEKTKAAKEELVALGKEAIPTLVAQLGTIKVLKKITLINVLTDIGEEAVPELLEALESENPRIRRDAAYILAKIEDERAIPSMVGFLNDEKAELRRIAAKGLGNMKHQEAVPQLIKLSDDPDEGVRRQVVIALGKIGDEEAIPTLLRSLQDEYFSVRFPASEALVKFGQVAFDPLISALRGKGFLTQSLVIETLGKIGDERAVKAIIEFLHSDDWSLRASAVEALGRIGGKKARSSIKKLSKKEKNGFVREKIAQAREELSSQ